MTKKSDELYAYYWQKFVNNLKNNGSTLSMSPTSAEYGREFVSRPGLNIPKGLDIVATISLLDKSYAARGCVEILIECPTSPAYRLSNFDYNRDAFHSLHDDKDAIEKELGLELDWMEWGLRPQLNKPNAKPRARISCFEYFNSDKEEDWHEHYPWFIETIEKFDRVFTPRLEKIKFSR